MKHETKPGWKPWKPPPKDERLDRWGVRGKTAWDWLNLMIVPVMLALFAGLFTTVQIVYQTAAEDARQQALADQTADFQRFLEEFRIQEESLQNYLDLMANLIVEHDLGPGGTKPSSEVTAIARTQTLTTLRKMDPQGKRTVVLFLSDARLITSFPGKQPIISLSEADLSGADLSGADLYGADLREAQLNAAQLTGADLRHADLSHADLSNDDLSDANLSHADLRHADLSHADLRYATGWTAEQLSAAKTLNVATMPDGQLLKGPFNPDDPTFEEWLKSKARGEDEENSGPS